MEMKETIDRLDDLETKVVTLAQLSMIVMDNYSKLGVINVAGTQELRDYICKCLDIQIAEDVKPYFLRSGKDFEGFICATMIHRANSI